SVEAYFSRVLIAIPVTLFSILHLKGKIDIGSIGGCLQVMGTDCTCGFRTEQLVSEAFDLIFHCTAFDIEMSSRDGTVVIMGKYSAGFFAIPVAVIRKSSFRIPAFVVEYPPIAMGGKCTPVGKESYG